MERLTVFQNLWNNYPEDQQIEKRWKKVTKEGTQLQDFPPFEALPGQESNTHG